MVRPRSSTIRLRWSSSSSPSTAARRRWTRVPRGPAVRHRRSVRPSWTGVGHTYCDNHRRPLAALHRNLTTTPIQTLLYFYVLSANVMRATDMHFNKRQLTYLLTYLFRNTKSTQGRDGSIKFRTGSRNTVISVHAQRKNGQKQKNVSQSMKFSFF